MSYKSQTPAIPSSYPAPMAIGEHEDAPRAPDDDVVERLKAAADLLESVVRDRSLLKALPLAERTRLLAAAGDVHNPDVVQRRRFNKVVRREKKAARLDRDESVLAETGIRVLRDKPVYTSPNVFPPRSERAVRAGRGRGRSRVPGGDRAAALLRLQAGLRRAAPLLRPALPAVRRLQLPQAHRDGRPARPRGAAHRRARQDRLPGGDQAAARGRAADRHHPLPARLRGPVRARAGLRRLGRPARDLRARPAPHAERRGVLRAPALDAGPARLHRQQRLPDRAPAGRVLPAHAGRRSRRRPDVDAGARPRAARRVRGAAPHGDAAGRLGRAVAGARSCPRTSPRRATCSPKGGSTRTCSRSICATATPGACCSTRCRRSSCSRRSSSTPSRRSCSTPASSR